MINTVAAQIDLSALTHNLGAVRHLCPQTRVMAMVKANGYGHGVCQVANALSDADGFAVARLEEALLLRRAGITKRILLLATLLNAEAVQRCSKFNIDVTAHDQMSVNTIVAQAWGTPLRVWLELDSGMHRAGLCPQAFICADRVLHAHPGVQELTHMSHFSNALDPITTGRQLECLFACRAASSQAPLSLANSAALIARPDTRADWVRPGIMLYGDNPAIATHAVPLRAAMQLTSRVVSIREIGGGEPVGYNNRWISTRPSRIGTIGIGYADGYPRHARNGTPVWISGSSAPLVGQVSMDSITVDLTELAQVSVGDAALLWGHELPAALIAAHASTISYDLFTSVSTRVTREYRS
jgi:alanine racemase